MLHWIDWFIIALMLALSLGIALYYARIASQGGDQFFLGGRNLPGWLAGISIAATTFAADTPLFVTELVRKDGISGNWMWWNMLIGGMFTTFFFARLWRRAGIVTDVEFVSIRYSGRAAHWLRSAKALYFGLLLNGVIIAWVNLAMATLLEVYFGLSPATALLTTGGLLLLTTLSASLGGLKGVVVADAFQFVIAMGGCIALAFIVLNSPEIGGVQGLQTQLAAAGQTGALRIFPTLSDLSSGQNIGVGLASMLTFFGLQWWAGWYPGNEPGGGGYVAQRLMATKNERQAMWASLIFQVLHYCLRPWPWIAVAIATVVLYPQLDEESYRQGYLMAMRDFLPVGLQGLLLAAFLAAYMSTISTQLNWGASYLMNDLWKPLRPGRTNRDFVRASRWATLLLALFGMLVSWQLGTLEAAFKFLIGASAGIGGVLVMRWYWWRVSAWSELVAMITPLLSMGILHLGTALALWPSWEFPYDFILVAVLTTLAWVLTSIWGPRTESHTLANFDARVQPQGWWPDGARLQGLGRLLACWLSAVAMAYALLYAIGAWLLGLTGLWQAITVAAVGGLVLFALMRHPNQHKPS